MTYGTFLNQTIETKNCVLVHAKIHRLKIYTHETRAILDIYIYAYIWWSTDPLMTLQPLSPRQAAGVPRHGHPADLHPHLPPGVRTVHGRTGQTTNSHPQPPLRHCRMDSWLGDWMHARSVDGSSYFILVLFCETCQQKYFNEWPLSDACVTIRFHS